MIVSRKVAGKPRRRFAFTLVELLVVIAIIGMLVALLLPAVQAARESARRMTCTNNVKNIALALINYEATHKTFPLGYTVYPSSTPTDWGSSWSRDILPFIEQTAIHDAWDDDSPPSAGVNLSLISTAIPLYKCPSSPEGPTYELDYYRAGTIQTVGVLDYVPTNETKVLPEGYQTEPLKNIAPGIMAVTGGLTFNSKRRRVTDGLSNTTLLTEKSGYPIIHIGADETHLHSLPSNGQSKRLTWFGHWARRARLTFQLPHKLFNTLPEDCSMNCTNYYEMQPYGFHEGGCNFAMGDGSVRFISEDITPQTLARLIARDDGQIVDEY